MYFLSCHFILFSGLQSSMKAEALNPLVDSVLLEVSLHFFHIRKYSSKIILKLNSHLSVWRDNYIKSNYNIILAVQCQIINISFVVFSFSHKYYSSNIAFTEDSSELYDWCETGQLINSAALLVRAQQTICSVQFSSF